LGDTLGEVETAVLITSAAYGQPGIRANYKIWQPSEQCARRIRHAAEVPGTKPEPHSIGECVPGACRSIGVRLVNSFNANVRHSIRRRASSSLAVAVKFGVKNLQYTHCRRRNLAFSLHGTLHRKSGLSGGYWLANFAISGGGAASKPGTIVYRFRLPNFVPAELLKASNNK
jgi:hypothetical protein